MKDLPNHWDSIKLGEACGVVLGQSPPSSSYNIDQEGLPFFQGKAEFGVRYPYPRKWCSKPKKIAQQNDILLSVRAPVGATNIAKERCCIGRGLAALRFPNYMYLYYYLQSIEGFLDSQGTGTTFRAVSGLILKSVPFPISPLPEQRAIVSKIEQLFSELDNGIANLKAAKAKLETYRQSVLKKAFEGEFTCTVMWGLRFEELFLDKPQNGLYKPKSDYGLGCKIIRIDGFYDGVIAENYAYQRVRIEDSEIEKYSVEVGDILINRVNSMSHLGKCGLVVKLDEATVFESNIMKVVVDQSAVMPAYLKYYLSSRKGLNELQKNAKQAVNQASINQKDVGNVLIPFCHLDDQRQIVNLIENRLSLTAQLSNDLDENLQKAGALRQSILKKAFEGRLLSEEEFEACRQQPDWEPAEGLLERLEMDKTLT